MPCDHRLGVLIMLFTLAAASGVAATARATALGTPATRGLPAPRTQPGTWEGGDATCPPAEPERDLPPHSGCVSVAHADVTGDGRSDLVVVSAALTGERQGSQYVPREFTVTVVQPGGAVVRAPIPRGGTDAFLARIGDVNVTRGDEIFVETERTSSGSDYDLFTWRAGRLVRVGGTFAAGGDSGVESGFHCTGGRRPAIVQGTYVPRGRLPGPWRWRELTFAWRGATLRRAGIRRFVRDGLPSRRATLDGFGCGRRLGPASTALSRD